jgi:hypothetical protein
MRVCPGTHPPQCKHLPCLVLARARTCVPRCTPKWMGSLNMSQRLLNILAKVGKFPTFRGWRSCGNSAPGEEESRILGEHSVRNPRALANCYKQIPDTNRGRPAKDIPDGAVTNITRTEAGSAVEVGPSRFGHAGVTRDVTLV